MTRPSLSRGRGPAALPPSAPTTCSEPELTARTRLSANLEEDMNGSWHRRRADRLRGDRATSAAEEVVAARPGWLGPGRRQHPGRRVEPGVHPVAWLGEPGRPQPGARFTGHNRFPNGFEYEVTCVVTEADRPRAFAWLVLDDSGDPARPSSSWRYQIDPLPGGGRVRQSFTHGPGASYLRAAAAKAPDRAAGIMAARWDGAAGQHERHLACDEARRGILSPHRRRPRVCASGPG